MAHLGNDFSSYDAFLNLADSVFSVDLATLNNSGVTGGALVAVGPTEESGARYVNIAISVEGMEPNQPVPQHIHGLFDMEGNPADSKTPDISADADRDGVVEVLEGLPNYGDIILTLTDSEGNAPMTDEDGKFTYVQNFDLNDASNFFSPVSMTDYEGADLLPLNLREIVLHGVSVPSGVGAGTEGEVNGEQDGFVPILPAAAGEIEQTTLENARDILEDLSARAGETVMLGDGGETALGGIGSDAIRGGAGDDRLDGASGNDVLNGGDGNDALLGRVGDDVIFGGAGDDNIAASDGNDEASGGAGNDQIGGGLGNDVLSGDGGDDMMGGGVGDDTLDGGAGDDVVNGGDGADDVQGAAGADTMGGGNGDDAVRGGADDDSLGGGGGNDTVEGGAGDDMIGAGVGDDHASGGDGNDFVAGGAGADMLHGNDGDDRLNGGSGDDVMSGGRGTDVFVFNEINDGETDVITDFVAGDETLVLRGVTGGFDALQISDAGSDGVTTAQVDVDGHTILLEGVASESLTDADFMFA
ncbi:calcium-binding protein [uncultured Roseovarius sp.]|uniref:calcium-binding protein n=1 Tax=uncultured Roseovarius sp. TaxID=293344 RepID=UPI0026323592|nr:calcium-binding protein [uncultured Roseovarius sp.]